MATIWTDRYVDSTRIRPHIIDMSSLAADSTVSVVVTRDSTVVMDNQYFTGAMMGVDYQLEGHLSFHFHDIAPE